jgi:hypothetical protein
MGAHIHRTLSTRLLHIYALLEPLSANLPQEFPAELCIRSANL